MAKQHPCILELRNFPPRGLETTLVASFIQTSDALPPIRIIERLRALEIFPDSGDGMMAKTGLGFVASKIKSEELSNEAYNEWYNNIHLPDVLASGGMSLALRYENTNPEAKMPYLALYPLQDVSFMQKGFWEIPVRNDNLPGGRKIYDFVEFMVRSYELIQTFEGQEAKPGRGSCIISVAMEPADGTDDDFDEWYRKQHLDMLSMCRGYRRSTRYKLVAGSDPALPRYLALHEYDSTELPTDQIKMVTSTEWSKRVIGNAKAFDRDVWRLIKQAGQTESKL